MMQVNEIQKHFNNIERSIEQVTQACRSNANVPQELKDCVQQLDREVTQIKRVLQSQDETRIRQSVDKLEQLSDRAEQTVDGSDEVDENLRSAILQAHSELSSLKHQLH